MLTRGGNASGQGREKKILWSVSPPNLERSVETVCFIRLRNELNFQHNTRPQNGRAGGKAPRSGLWPILGRGCSAYRSTPGRKEPANRSTGFPLFYTPGYTFATKTINSFGWCAEKPDNALVNETHQSRSLANIVCFDMTGMHPQPYDISATFIP